MESHGFLSGKCKHGSPNFCTLCDIEGNPERYTNQLLADVIQEVEEYRKMPLSERLQSQLLAYKSAQQGVHPTLLIVRANVVICPQCENVFDVDMPAPQSG
jgi:hypothetical protein